MENNGLRLPQNPIMPLPITSPNLWRPANSMNSSNSCIFNLAINNFPVLPHPRNINLPSNNLQNSNFGNANSGNGIRAQELSGNSILNKDNINLQQQFNQPNINLPMHYLQPENSENDLKKTPSIPPSEKRGSPVQKNIQGFQGNMNNFNPYPIINENKEENIYSSNSNKLQAQNPNYQAPNFGENDRNFNPNSNDQPFNNGQDAIINNIQRPFDQNNNFINNVNQPLYQNDFSQNQIECQNNKNEGDNGMQYDNLNNIEICESLTLEENTNNNEPPTQKIKAKIPGKNINISKEIHKSFVINPQTTNNEFNPNQIQNKIENKFGNNGNENVENKNNNNQNYATKSLKKSFVIPGEGQGNFGNQKSNNQVADQKNMVPKKSKNLSIYRNLDLSVSNKSLKKFMLNEQAIREKKGNPTVGKLIKLYKRESQNLKDKWGCMENNGKFRDYLSKHIIIPRYLDWVFDSGSQSSREMQNIPIEIPVMFDQCPHCEPMELSTLKFEATKKKIYGFCYFCQNEFKHKYKLHNLHVDQKHYRFLQSLVDDPGQSLFVFSKSVYNDEILILEESVRYNSDTTTTHSVDVNRVPYKCEIPIYEMGLLKFHDMKVVSLILTLMSEKLNINLINVNPELWLTINSFVDKGCREQILNGLDKLINFSGNKVKLIVSDNSNQFENRKLSSPSVFCYQQAFSIACSIIFGTLSICFVDDLIIEDFLVTYSILKLILNIEDYQFFIVLITNDESFLGNAEDGNASDQRRKFEAAINCPYKAIRKADLNQVLLKIKEGITNFDIESKKITGLTKEHNITHYLYNRLKSVNFFGSILGKERSSDFTANNIVADGLNIKINFSFTDDLRGVIYPFDSRIIPFIPSLEIDCLKAFEKFNFNNPKKAICSFNCRFSYDLIKNLSKRVALIFASPEIQSQLYGIKLANNEEFLFYTSNIIDTASKKCSPKVRSCSPEVQTLLVNVIAMISSSSLFKIPDESTENMLHILIESKLKNPSLTKLPALIFVDEQYLIQNNFNFLNFPLHKGNDKSGKGFCNYDFTGSNHGFEDFQRFIAQIIPNYSSYSNQLIVKAIELPVMKKNENDISLRLYYYPSLGIYLTFYNEQKTLSTVFKILRSYIPAKEALLQTGKIESSIIFATKMALESCIQIYGPTSNLCSVLKEVETKAFKSLEDRIYGVRYEVRLDWPIN